MALIDWEERFSVGVEEIDGQHKTLVEMLNRLHGAMFAQGRSKIVTDTVDEMAHYAVSHFATEEKHMMTFGYPGYADHKAEHDAFTKKVLDLQIRLANGSLVLSAEVIVFLRDWLTDHILGADKAFGPFFNDKGLR